MAGETEFWVDMSFDPLTDTEAEGLRDAGVKGIMQCLWTGVQQPPPRVTNLRIGDQHGLDLMGYASLPIGGLKSGLWNASMARSGVPNDLWDQLLLVPVDVELDRIPVQAVRDMVEVFAMPSYGSKRRCIYTSYNAWVNKMGNPTTFTDCLLYNAYWDGAPDLDFASLPFGGWTIQKVVGEQWSGGTHVAGQFADRNQFVTSLLRPSPVVDPCALSKLRVTFLEEVSKAALEGDGKTLIRWGKFFGG